MFTQWRGSPSLRDWASFTAPLRKPTTAATREPPRATLATAAQPLREAKATTNSPSRAHARSRNRYPMSGYETRRTTFTNILTSQDFRSGQHGLHFRVPCWVHAFDGSPPNRHSVEVFIL